MKLPLKFYQRPTLTIAQDLLGKILVRNKNGVITAGEIIETEAYGENDPASHAFRGLTSRNQPMFGPPGRAYVYFVYGMYHCFNVVTEKKGRGAAVLVRALRPIRGLAVMGRRVRSKNKSRLALTRTCAGPGKLCLAMAIDKKLNKTSLLGNEIYILKRSSLPKSQIKITPRIGIKEGRSKLWRFVKKEPWTKSVQ